MNASKSSFQSAVILHPASPESQAGACYSLRQLVNYVLKPGMAYDADGGLTGMQAVVHGVGASAIVRLLVYRGA